MHTPQARNARPGAEPGETQAPMCMHMRTWMFTAAIFAMTKCVQPNHPLLRAKMDKLRSIHNESLQNEV